MTPLDKTLKRGLSIKGVEYVVTLTPEALKLTRKGRRLGMELKWSDITSGESALAVALHASIGKFEKEAKNPPSDAGFYAKKLPRKSRGSSRKLSARRVK